MIVVGLYSLRDSQNLTSILLIASCFEVFCLLPELLGDRLLLLWPETPSGMRILLFFSVTKFGILESANSVRIRLETDAVKSPYRQFSGTDRLNKSVGYACSTRGREPRF